MAEKSKSRSEAAKKAARTRQMKKVKNNDVKFLTSVALAMSDKDDIIRHVQIVISQRLDDGQFLCFFDVVDPSKIKLQDDSVHSSDNA